MRDNINLLVINENRVEIGGPIGTKTNPHFLALRLVQLKLVRGSTRGKDVDGRLDAAHLILEYCFRDGRVIDILP